MQFCVICLILCPSLFALCLVGLSEPGRRERTEVEGNEGHAGAGFEGEGQTAIFPPQSGLCLIRL